MANPRSSLGPIPPGVDATDYDRRRRRILWMLPSGLYLLGSTHQGRRNLMTLSWATQVSTDPKLVGVSVETTALTHELVDGGGVFALSLLGRDDRSVARRFVKPAQDSDDHLNGFTVRTARTGAPVLDQAAAWIDCEVRQRVPCGSHVLFVGEVVDCGGNDDEAEVLRMEDTRMSYGG